MLYQLTDHLFTALHLAIVIFILCGWIWPYTRRTHLYLVMATIFSWVVLGIWYGFGYCAITDWQWQVKEKLGETGLPNSFIKYIADHVSGRNVDPDLVDGVTAAAFGMVVIITLYLAIFRKK